MNWFRENRFLGTFAIVFGVAVLGAGWFLFSAKGDSDEAAARFANAFVGVESSPAARALSERGEPPQDEGAHRGLFERAGKLKEELKVRVAPAPPLKPNEFQSQLRLAINAVTDKARGNKIKLPDKFFLGFDEFVAALPEESAAPFLGQELAQIDWLVNGLLEARWMRSPLYGGRLWQSGGARTP